MRARRLVGWTAPLGVAAAFLASQSIAFAYPSPPATAKVTSGCSTVNQGASCNFTFQFSDASGTGVDGQSVTFSVSGVSGCPVSPTSGTTAGGGFVSTALSCSSNSGTGNGTLTATGGSVSVQAAFTVNPANAGGGGGTLPFTSTNPPGPNGWLIAGLTLAGAIILAGASYLTVNRRRRTPA